MLNPRGLIRPGKEYGRRPRNSTRPVSANKNSTKFEDVFFGVSWLVWATIQSAPPLSTKMTRILVRSLRESAEDSGGFTA
ncbi:unnamed protein product [Clonostachys chloroleuca]|uniref:Uncharacterized protein n=1 Tax=Clonostachys chloroleuca TaxID=1926264 RepID=A0AA35VKJ1_9HYPO|nr:unnamed protein product [Clonostachys chloroleuca]